MSSREFALTRERASADRRRRPSLRVWRPRPLLPRDRLFVVVLLHLARLGVVLDAVMTHSRRSTYIREDLVGYPEKRYRDFLGQISLLPVTGTMQL